jgi:hypothetical protein
VLVLVSVFVVVEVEPPPHALSANKLATSADIFMI